MKFNVPPQKCKGISNVFHEKSNNVMVFVKSTFYKLNVPNFFFIVLLTSYVSHAQCSYTGTPLTQVGSTYTFCVDNGTTYTSGTVNSGQYIMVNVVKGFRYTFSVGNVFTANENLTILNASTNGNVSPATFASGASGATISNWVSSLSGQIKVLLSRGSCSNANVTGGAITLTLNSVGNTQDSQTAFGTDQWVAHVYNWTGSPAPGGTSPSTPSTTTAPFTNASYVGYYTIGSESISETFGGDYNCFPVYSNGVIRTNMYTEQYAIRYRMRSTKTGCYSLSTTGDDGVRVYVDGVKVYDEWKEQVPTSYSNILLYLNGNSDVIFDYYENGGQNVNSFSLTPFDGGSNTIAQSSVTVCSGVSPGALNGSSYTYNGASTNPTISFQWQSSTDNVNFTNISGGTTEDYTPPTQTTTTTNVVRYYRRIVTAAAATASGCTYTSNVSTVITSPGIPGTPATISGTATQCSAITGQVYSITAVTNTTSYNWTVPTGWTITSGAGTTSITVTTGTSGQNGNISVAAVNGCGSSANRTLAVTVNSNNTVGVASTTPTLCINTALTSITHTSTGATGIGTATGLPTGVSAAWASNTITINGTPSVSGTFAYSIPLTGGCGLANATGTITVTPNKTASVASSTPTLCINTALTAITHTTTGAAGIGTATGLPTGVSAAWASNTITISGTPSASGTFAYTIPLTGGCGTVNATGTITVTPNKTASAASSTPTLCINTALTAITHTTTGATGIGIPTNLPAGVTAAWATNTIAISGTPTASGTFNYTIPLTGGCGTVNATGTITVRVNNTVSAASSSPTLCINTALIAITHTTTGATGIGTPINLPTGITAVWATNTITISGTPTASGTFNYSIPLIGGCGTVNATGTITVTPNKTASAASSTPTLCINTALTAITHTTTGATGIGTATGLPTGVTAVWATNTITISGTPTTSGTFNYSIPLTGGCGSAAATGTITVRANNTVSGPSSFPSVCINTAMTPITHTTTGATGIGTVAGLPTGVTAAWATNTITISGTPTTSGTFNYSIPLTGGCTTINATGTITINARPTASVISGTATICSGSPTNLSVAIIGGASPYNVVYSAGSVNGYTSGSNISVSPTSTTTYTLTSVTDANGCVGIGNIGSAVVTIDSTTSTNGGVSWSNGSPSSTKSVIFDGSSATIDLDLLACSLRLTNNATVTVASGSDVTLNGRLTVDSGSTFTLNNNANLLQNTTLANSGNIVVKRNSSALKRLDYTLWSSPVTGQKVYSFSPFTFGNRFYVYRTNTNLFNNADVGFSLTGLDANGVNGTDSNNVQFALAKGYLIRMPWDHPTAATVWNGTFTGVPNNGDITYTMTNGGTGQRFNLVGNPYPSPISMTQFVADNSAKITGTLYFWRETNNNTTNNAYCTWAGGTFTSNNEAQVFNPNNIIRTGQGFFVEASGAVTSVDFKNGQRSTDNTNQFFKTTNASNDVVETNRFWLNLTNATGAFCQMAAGYMTNATNGVDVYDGKNINTGNILLNSILDNTDYTIQGKSLPFNASDVIPLSYKVTVAGSYTIAIDHTDGVFTNGAQAIYLKDNLTGTIQSLTAGSYTFASDPGTFTNRFEVLYQSQLSSPTFTANSVVIYSQNSEFVINSGNTTMASVKVFDIRGRLLQERNNIKANQTTISGGMTNEVLLVQITSEDGVVVTKKVIR